ncbi:hypothetical protein OAU81_00625 [bacterium]|nr:hypothetical protein [bacterium]
MTADYSIIEGMIRQTTNNPINKMTSNPELYIVEAVEVNKHQSLHDQKDNWSTYCVCDSKHTANAIIQKDMKTGDILRGRIALHVLQTAQDV